MPKEIQKEDDMPYTPAEDEYEPDVLFAPLVIFTRPKRLDEDAKQIDS